MSLHNVSIGKKAPEVVNVVVEIPKGSQNKYEFDEETGAIFLDRVGYSALRYPTDYGLIPETRSEDGDHLDAMVIGGDPMFPGCVVKMRPIGIIRMTDTGEEDFKVIGVQKDNPRFNGVNDIEDVKKFDTHFVHEVTHFWEHYAELQPNKEVKVLEWAGAEEAKKEIKRAQETYSKEK